MAKQLIFLGEIHKSDKLHKIGEKNADKYDFVKRGIAKFYQTDGSQGFTKEAPYDKILVSAAAENIPERLKEQLKIGGQMIIPVKNNLVLVEKTDKDKYSEKEFFGFSFVPLIIENK